MNQNYVVQVWNATDRAWYDQPEKKGTLHHYPEKKIAFDAAIDPKGMGLDVKDCLHSRNALTYPFTELKNGHWRVYDV